MRLDQFSVLGNLQENVKIVCCVNNHKENDELIPTKNATLEPLVSGPP